MLVVAFNWPITVGTAPIVRKATHSCRRAGAAIGQRARQRAGPTARANNATPSAMMSHFGRL